MAEGFHDQTRLSVCRIRFDPELLLEDQIDVLSQECFVIYEPSALDLTNLATLSHVFVTPNNHFNRLHMGLSFEVSCKLQLVEKDKSTVGLASLVT